MAIIKKSGVGNILSGTIDGVEYVTTRSGVTYVRSVPQMPARIYKTPKALKRQALFRFIQMHRKTHFKGCPPVSLFSRFFMLFPAFSCKKDKYC